MHKSHGEASTGKAQVEGPALAARRRWWRALGGGKAQVEVAVLAARRRLRLLRWALGGGKAQVEERAHGLEERLGAWNKKRL